MKPLTTFILFAFFLVSVFAETTPERMWFVKNNCEIIINGKSNVNSFSCKVEKYNSADNLVLFYKPGNKYSFSGNKIVIDPQQFDCGKAQMTKDFQQVLKADENPEITISFVSLSKLPCDSCKEDFVIGLVRITMAGVTKETFITFSVKPSSEGIKTLYGEHFFSFSDFHLSPPTKFMGMVHVKNELTVSFFLQFQEMALK